MYYSVKSGEGKGRLDTAVSADSPFEAACKAVQQFKPSSMGLIIECKDDNDLHYCLTTNVLKAIGASVDECDA
jgi:hypothetical protein